MGVVGSGTRKSSKKLVEWITAFWNMLTSGELRMASGYMETKLQVYPYGTTLRAKRACPLSRDRQRTVIKGSRAIRSRQLRLDFISQEEIHSTSRLLVAGLSKSINKP